METQRIAPSTPAPGTHAPRHKAAQGAPEGLAAFSAVLSGLGESDAEAAADAPVLTESPSPSAVPLADGVDLQWAPLDAGVLSWTPPVAGAEAAGDTAGGNLGSSSGSVSSRLSAVSSGAAPATGGLPTTQAPHSGTPANAGSPVADRGALALEGAGASAIGKLATQSEASDAVLPKPAPDLSSLRAAGAVATNPRDSANEAAQSLLGQRSASLQHVAPGAVSDLAQAVQGALGPQGISHAAVGLVAQTARMDGAADTVSGEASTASAKPPGAGRKPVFAASLDKGQRLAEAADVVQRHVAQAAADRPGAARDLRAGWEAGQLQQAQQKSEGVRASVGEPVLVSSVAAAPLAMAPWLADRRIEGGPARLEQRDPLGASGVLAVGDAGAPSDQPPGVGSADGSAMSPEEAVTEQVTYWLSENLKNAELTVDHGGQAIDVRVSLAGNEAHVAFRSDQAQTRELLDASMGQLRDLLRNEGLVLSGVSVDAHAAGQDSQQGARAARPAGREGRAELPVGAEGPMLPTRRILTERSVDLFV